MLLTWMRRETSAMIIETSATPITAEVYPRALRATCWRQFHLRAAVMAATAPKIRWSRFRGSARRVWRPFTRSLLSEVSAPFPIIVREHHLLTLPAAYLSTLRTTTIVVRELTLVIAHVYQQHKRRPAYADCPTSQDIAGPMVRKYHLCRAPRERHHDQDAG